MKYGIEICRQDYIGDFIRLDREIYVIEADEELVGEFNCYMFEEIEIDGKTYGPGWFKYENNYQEETTTFEFNPDLSAMPTLPAYPVSGISYGEEEYLNELTFKSKIFDIVNK